MAYSKQDYVDLGQKLAALASLIAGVVALQCKNPCLGIVVAAIVDIFIILLIRSAAIRSTPGAGDAPGPEVFPWLPTRIAALTILPLLLLALVASFGGIYAALPQGVVDSQCPPQPLKDWFDALYFSAVTVTTVGYGDFHPATTLAKCTVMGEIVSGIIVLVGAFPLLVGRLTTWKS